MKLGSLIYKIRNSRRLSREKLASLVDLEFHRMKDIEDCVSLPSLTILCKICKELDASISLVVLANGRVYAQDAKDDEITSNPHRGIKKLELARRLYDSNKHSRSSDSKR